MARSHDTLIQYRDLVLPLFCRLGFIINLAKSDMVPTQDFVFFGLWLNTLSMSVSLTLEKIDKLRLRAACIL